MKRGQVKLGAPSRGDSAREELPQMSIRLDPEAEAALEALKPAGAVRGWRSVLVRRLILDEADRVRRRDSDGTK